MSSSKGRSSYSPTAGLPFDDEDLESRLVWIFGSPRSGSTWLLRMLCHPLRMDSQRFRRDSHRELGFHWRPAWQGSARALPVNEFQIGAHLAPGIYGDPNSTIEGDDGEVLPRTLNRVVDYFSGYAFSTPYADVWRPEFRRLTLVRLHAVVERAREAGLSIPEDPLLVIKEVNGSHAADLIMSLFPRSRMILLARDGRDVLDSLVDASGPEGWLTKVKWRGAAFETPEERLEFVRQKALNWRARMTVCVRAYEGHDAQLRFKVRYEDLLADTEANLTQLTRWLGLPSGPKRMAVIAKEHGFDKAPAEGAGKPWRAASPGAWRDGLTVAEQETASEIMAPVLAELGYET
jgi:hypothetical protein